MSFWQGKRVTVTGGAGFLGAFLVQRLQERGADVFVPRSRAYDLTTKEHAQRMYQDARPEILLHLAARVGGIGANQRNPGLFFHENMAMGMHVLEEGRRYGALAKLVIVGTTCSYPKFTPTPFKEEDFWNGYPEETNAPYGIAKRSLLAMSWGYREQYGMNVIYLIPANLFGPRDNFDLETGHVIPALIRKFVEARDNSLPRVTLWGTGEPSREFLYAEDAAEGLLLASERYEKPDPVNLGTGQEVRIRELAGLVERLVGYRGEIVWDTTRPNGQPRRCLDTSRARSEFGFEAKTSLEEGLKRTIDWYASQKAAAEV
ncbi:MAG: GDP-L-fucose synthase [Dehalococcoidia bacterium]|nr:GDP-L-fucose synthase [Dehalococcoidia bacterium]